MKKSVILILSPLSADPRGVGRKVPEKASSPHSIFLLTHFGFWVWFKSMLVKQKKNCIKWNSDVLSNQVTTIKYSLERKHAVNGSSEAYFRLRVSKQWPTIWLHVFIGKVLLTHRPTYLLLWHNGRVEYLPQRPCGLQSQKYLISDLM